MDDRTEAVEAEPKGDKAEQVPAWLRATSADVIGLDFEAPLANSTTADCHELSDIYRAAMKPSAGATGPDDTATTRVFAMLSALAGMHFKPREHNEPFGPMWTLTDGRRSAIPSDFRLHADLLAELANRATNPVLRARLSDLCWLLDRKRGRLALAAISAYVSIVEKTGKAELKFRFAADGSVLEHDARDYLRRALQIGRAVGWEKSETMAARELVGRLREQALATRVLVPSHWFCDLDLDFAVSDPADIGGSLDKLLADLPDNGSSHAVVDLWRLAARAYQFSKRDDDRNRCLSSAAKQLVVESQSQQASAMLASHFLSSAIAQLHGVPGKKDRRIELRHQLIDVQARVSEEMSVFSQELDLREMAEKVQKVVGRVDLPDMLFIFADLERSPDPQALTSDAAKMIEKHPLSSIFGTAHMDREGKVIHRSQGSGLGDGSNSSATDRSSRVGSKESCGIGQD
jgi:hypothetical protein